MKIISNVTVDISTPPSFSFAEQLRFMALFPLECRYQIVEGALYQAIRGDTRPVVLQVTAPAAGTLRVSWVGHDGSVAATDAQAAAAHVKAWLDLDRDLRPFYELAAQDVVLKPAIAAYRGLHLVGIPDLFEALAWAIIGQQIHMTFAYRLKARLIQAFGEFIDDGERRHWLFPLPEKMASLSIDDLLPLQFSRQKAAYLIGVAQAIVDGQISKARLATAETPAAMKAQLLALKGIGPWTADYVLMICLRQPTAYPIGDVGLQNAVKKQLGLAAKPSPTELMRIAELWQGWEAYATFYLWRTGVES
ncbi:DNA-3-methyladenine glycosylase family protein [Heliophilum fasciatum]|uniref:DNA-3-methyladenine glycosylase II n=1 Tax=Heliophilum fasciatum TaxID=35700 RepID=A0A4R2RPZ4_9FIRM|nr:DNA-3-methyladenine glycosylase [Heliophilum fasciatum]MCW2277562.1 DNA-3-methyladenine glycosylase II [Heliophilum fasciatum]TCP65148.1 DNA-3-methyladenine glycosylase II [Heliophilum fasciatum]